MDVVIDPNSTVPPYEQLRAGIASQVSDGRLSAGVKLPTVRGLAGELGLAVNTVARAYRELEASGLIETRGRAGSFVGARGDLSRDRVRLAAAEYAATASDLGISEDEALAIVTAALRSA